jgi:DNA-binding response OmpR family regulator
MPVSAKKPLLLFVDDDPIIVDALSIVLQNDFDVITAESRKQVKSLLQDLSVKPSLALVDLGLPPKPHSPEEGFKLIEELMSLNDSFKILVLSGQNEDINIHHALTLGAVDFIPKPCDMSLLRSRLEYQMTMLQAESSEK